MVDKQEIRKLFKHWFDTDSAEFKVNDDGTISCEGSITTDYNFPGKLPVKFKEFKGTLFLRKANLHTLEGSPEYMDGDLRVSRNQLTNLKGAPEVITGVFNIMKNPLTSLEGFPSSVGTVFLDDDPNLPMLRLLTAQEIKIQGSRDPNYTVSNILNKYAGQGKRAMFDAQKELEDAGFEKNARW
jgi:hypothetical protein